MASSSAMDNFSTAVAFPQRDMLQEILQRLDTKSITRFKLISKTWNEFISNPYFSKLYSKFRPPITAFFYKTNEYVQKMQYMPLHPNQESIIDPLGFLDRPAILLHSCNGLLHWRTYAKIHYISNPLNNKFVPIDWPFPEVFASGIAFDPSVSDHFEVVVLFRNSGTSSSLKSKSFSSDTMEWGSEKETSVTNFKIIPYCPYRGVLINGVLYWELKYNTLLAYNVKDRIDWFIELPMSSGIHNIWDYFEPGCLGESNGKLHYARVWGTTLIVFEQSSENSANWATLHMIDLNGVSMSRNQVLAFLDGCKGVLLSIENKIKAYNMEDKSKKQVCDVSGLPFAHVLPSVFFPFMHTMALSSFRSV